VIKLVIDSLGILRPGANVLHLAPETSLYNVLVSVAGEGVIPTDYNISRYKRRFKGIRRLDLCGDYASVSDRRYDLILHSHVMEHIPCNYAVALKRLNDLLKPKGYQVCSIPISRGRYEECLGLPPELATERFGHPDHVRRFGVEDLQATLGKVIPMAPAYDLLAKFDAATLTRHNIPEATWKGYSAHSVLYWRKDEFLLADQQHGCPRLPAGGSLSAIWSRIRG